MSLGDFSSGILESTYETGSHSWAAFGPREVEKRCEMRGDDENSFPLMGGRFLTVSPGQGVGRVFSRTEEARGSNPLTST